MGTSHWGDREQVFVRSYGISYKNSSERRSRDVAGQQDGVSFRVRLRGTLRYQCRPPIRNQLQTHWTPIVLATDIYREMGRNKKRETDPHPRLSWDSHQPAARPEMKPSGNVYYGSV